jgi:hypothetical protein
MTKQSLRIYVYRITFEEVLHYYYGSHKEKRFDEYYMGSPVTHKNFWELYTPKKEYIEFFEFSDEGYTEARIFEDSLIAPVLNDEFCLNENCGGSLSLKTYRKGGKIGGNKTKENKTGIFGLSPEERSEASRKSGHKNKENKTGIFSLSLEELSEAGKKSGNKHKENKTGFCGLSSEELSEAGKKANSQKWQCIETGYISTACGLTNYQNKRGIDTSKRIKVDGPRGWEITFEDGRVGVTYQSLKDWAKENGYSYNHLQAVRAGKSPNYRGIIKVVPL